MVSGGQQGELSGSTTRINCKLRRQQVHVASSYYWSCFTTPAAGRKFFSSCLGNSQWETATTPPMKSPYILNSQFIPIDFCSQKPSHSPLSYGRKRAFLSLSSCLACGFALPCLFQIAILCHSRIILFFFFFAGKITTDFIFKVFVCLFVFWGFFVDTLYQTK